MQVNHFAIPGLLLLFSGGGCKESSAPTIPVPIAYPSAESADDVPLSLEVIESAAMIEAARQMAAAKRVAPLSAEALSDIWYSLDGAIPEEMDPEEAKARLGALLQGEPPIRIRATAAALLWSIDADTGQEAVIGLLALRDKELRDAIGALANLDLSGSVVSNPDLTMRLSSLLSDPEVGTATIRLCGRLQSDELTEALWTALPGANHARQGLILRELARKQPARALQACQAAKGELRYTSGGAWDQALLLLLNADDPEVRTAAATVMASDLQDVLRNGSRVRPDRFEAQCLAVLAAATGPEAATLADLVEAHCDSQLHDGAYACKRRLEGEAGKARVVSDLGQPQTRGAALMAIEANYAGTGDPTLMNALISAAEPANQDELRAVCRAILALDGEEVEATIARVSRGMPEGERNRWRRAAADKAPAKVAQRLAEAGLISSDQDSLAGYLAKDEFGEDARLETILASAGRAVSFDMETGVIPVRHDRLIEDFRRAGAGQFRPESCHEMMQSRFEDDIDAPYVVQFVHANRLYRFTARNYGDWYDVDRVITVCNRALRDSGSEYEFCLDADGGSYGTVFCVTQAQKELLNEKFFVTWELSSNRAVESVATEKRAIKELLGGHQP